MAIPNTMGSVLSFLDGDKEDINIYILEKKRYISKLKIKK